MKNRVISPLTAAIVRTTPGRWIFVDDYGWASGPKFSLALTAGAGRALAAAGWRPSAAVLPKTPRAWWLPEALDDRPGAFCSLAAEILTDAPSRSLDEPDAPSRSLDEPGARLLCEIAIALTDRPEPPPPVAVAQPIEQIIRAAVGA